jgi:hypothetical protein
MKDTPAPVKEGTLADEWIVHHHGNHYKHDAVCLREAFNAGDLARRSPAPCGVPGCGLTPAEHCTVKHTHTGRESRHFCPVLMHHPFVAKEGGR